MAGDNVYVNYVFVITQFVMFRKHSYSTSKWQTFLLPCGVMPNMFNIIITLCLLKKLFTICTKIPYLSSYTYSTLNNFG